MTIRRTISLLLLSALLMLGAAPAFAQKITQEIISVRVRQMIAVLRARQSPDGSWAYGGKWYQVGATALAVTALKTAGVANNDPAIQRACNYLETHITSSTYEEGLVPCALELVDPKRYQKRISIAAEFLMAHQRASGGWGYTNQDMRYTDESCSQYAVLGLAAAQRCGIKVDPDILARAKRYYYASQQLDGGWSYRAQRTGTSVSMTCAGLASLALLEEKLEKPGNKCGDYRVNTKIAKGFGFLSRKLPAYWRSADSQRWGFYAMYGLERTGILYQVKQIGKRDWYTDGCRLLINSDKWSEDPVNTSFALLFITKNDAPYAITKWRWAGDWNNDHDDVSTWVKVTSEEIKQPLDWQVASLEKELGLAARSSLIFVNGHRRFNASDEELQAIRKFLSTGGIVVGEGCCNSGDFIRGFRDVMQEKLFPDKKLAFRKLTGNHAILNGVHKLTSDQAGIYVLGKGCSRKQVYLLSREVSCSLNGDEKSVNETERSKKVAVNLMVYALGKRKPQSKFTEVKFQDVSLTDALAVKARKGKGHVYEFENPLGRIRHEGDWATDPGFYSTLSRFLDKHSELVAFDGEVVIDPETDDLFGCSTIWITGHGVPRVSRKAMVNLRRFVQNGGFIVAEPCCSDAAFRSGIQKMLKAIFPNRPLEKLDLSHPIYKQPYRLSKSPIKGTNAYHEEYKKNWPTLYGMRDGDRLAVVYCPVDFSCSLDGDLEEDVIGLKLESSLQLIANILSSGMSYHVEEE